MRKVCLMIMVAAIPLAGVAGCHPATAGEGAASQNGVQPSMNDSRNVGPTASQSGYTIAPLPREKVAELAKKLNPEAYRITQKADTERPFCGTLLDNKKDGVYACVVCDLPLFSSDHKFNSGTGWPSFYKEFDPQHVARTTDRAHGMARTEITCARCTAHLGHVFDDGPKPSGQRHCLNSASLKFYDKGQEPKPDAAGPIRARSASEGEPGQTGKTPASYPGADAPDATETAYFAGGCFWGIEHYFQEGPGVIDAVSGYMQGKMEKPTYKQVCTDTTGHAETVKVVFDPKEITFRRLLEAFFVMHDPTQLNYQGPDHGTQYRSGIYTTSEAQKREADAYVAELAASGRYSGKKIVTEIESAMTFWPAEDYHQDYVATTGRACHVANPW